MQSRTYNISCLSDACKVGLLISVVGLYMLSRVGLFIARVDLCSTELVSTNRVFLWSVERVSAIRVDVCSTKWVSANRAGI